ncbi:hypothetical protein DPMN_167358 [Dreissena polymorpha]|uniref:Uncharacterized protein n=1 Tax=Dreissena polymorpha TaxID=45954 RepID=A0A9D4IWA4_DREPO|nr:hypothetical protein DPMN_167358 [Dreissena polymorpha]
MKIDNKCDFTSVNKKNAQPPISWRSCFSNQPELFSTRPRFIGTNLVTKPYFQETGTIFELIQESIRTNVLTMLTRFYYSHIRKKPAPGGHVFQPIQREGEGEGGGGRGRD